MTARFEIQTEAYFHILTDANCDGTLDPMEEPTEILEAA